MAHDKTLKYKVGDEFSAGPPVFVASRKIEVTCVEPGAGSDSSDIVRFNIYDATGKMLGADVELSSRLDSYNLTKTNPGTGALCEPKTNPKVIHDTSSMNSEEKGAYYGERVGYLQLEQGKIVTKKRDIRAIGKTVAGNMNAKGQLKKGDFPEFLNEFIEHYLKVSSKYAPVSNKAYTETDIKGGVALYEKFVGRSIDSVGKIKMRRQAVLVKLARAHSIMYEAIKHDDLDLQLYEHPFENQEINVYWDIANNALVIMGPDLVVTEHGIEG